jgi:hypothetical protein
MFSGKLKLKDGQLIYTKEYDTALGIFIKGLPEGQEIEVFMSISDSKGSTAQIAKIHKCIRELANDIGYSFDDMKTLVKGKSGLIINNNIKSFADCSKEELSSAIQTCIEIGEFYGINLH